MLHGTQRTAPPSPSGGHLRPVRRSPRNRQPARLPNLVPVNAPATAPTHAAKAAASAASAATAAALSSARSLEKALQAAPGPLYNQGQIVHVTAGPHEPSLEGMCQITHVLDEGGTARQTKNSRNASGSNTTRATQYTYSIRNAVSKRTEERVGAGRISSIRSDPGKRRATQAQAPMRPPPIPPLALPRAIARYAPRNAPAAQHAATNNSPPPASNEGAPTPVGGRTRENRNSIHAPPPTGIG